MFVGESAGGNLVLSTLLRAKEKNLPHPKECNIWYEAYVKSPAIMRAADNFWANAPAPDGVGLQEHYERMWEHIAEYFAECTNIIGLEPMNEPYMGSIAPQAFAAAVEQVQKGNPQFDLDNPETARPEDIAVMQQSLNNRFMKFDAEILMPFYSRMLGAIRKHTDAALVTGGQYILQLLCDDRHREARGSAVKAESAGSRRRMGQFSIRGVYCRSDSVYE